ncbi:MAG: OmpW family protein [Rickettsiaceae bacterium]|nr:OmpW family protein [Rickettsiaceae bacterium]
MYKSGKKLLLLSLLFINNTHASNNAYYQDEGQILFKFKGVFYQTSSTKTPFSTSLGTATSTKNIFSLGYGAEGSVTYFYSSNIAGELSAGVNILKLRSSQINAIAQAIGTNSAVMDKKKVTAIPISAILQYHIAPYGGIRPYIGAGYSGSFLTTRSKHVSVESGHGPVFQLGVDLVSRSDNYVSLELKQYFLKTKVTLEQALLDATNQTLPKTVSKVKLNPTTISLGFGFRL